MDRPLAVLLVKVSEPKHDLLEGLLRDVFPIYPSTSRVTLPSRGRVRSEASFPRMQVPCTAGFTITDYQSQGHTFEQITIDFTTSTRNLSEHKTFCSLYVALSRCKSVSGVSLRTPLSQRQFLARPNYLLYQEIQRLQILAQRTEQMSCCNYLSDSL